MVINWLLNSKCDGLLCNLPGIKSPFNHLKTHTVSTCSETNRYRKGIKEWVSETNFRNAYNSKTHRTDPDKLSQPVVDDMTNHSLPSKIS